VLSTRPYLAAMSVEAMQVFTAMLALAAAALAVFVVVGRLLRGRAGLLDEALHLIDDAALWLAFLVAGGAMAGSLYFSEVANYLPCRLCWFQRIAMYPLAVILLIAALRGDRAIRWYAIPLAVLGACVSIYHYLVEWHPQLEGDACDPTNPCSLVWFREFGFVTLSLMALCGFAAIIALLATATAGELDDTLERPGS
jgi:disulfide bond formation protein DsbB